jgi:hypothetical protein
VRIYPNGPPNNAVGVFDDDCTIFLYSDSYGHECVGPKVVSGLSEPSSMEFAVQSICVLSERSNLVRWSGRNVPRAAVLTEPSVGHVLDAAEPAVVAGLHVRYRVDHYAMS